MESKTKYRLLAGGFVLGVALVAGVVKPGRLSGKAVGGDPGEGCGAADDAPTEEPVQQSELALNTPSQAAGCFYFYHPLKESGSVADAEPYSRIDCNSSFGTEHYPAAHVRWGTN